MVPAFISMSGGVMSGNCATGKPRIVTAPAINVTIAMTIDSTGRSMNNRAAVQLSCGAGLALTLPPALRN